MLETEHLVENSYTPQRAGEGDGSSADPRDLSPLFKWSKVSSVSSPFAAVTTSSLGLLLSLESTSDCNTLCNNEDLVFLFENGT